MSLGMIGKGRSNEPVGKGQPYPKSAQRRFASRDRDIEIVRLSGPTPGDVVTTVRAPKLREGLTRFCRDQGIVSPLITGNVASTTEGVFYARYPL